jgi:hypothetical protein
MSYSIDDINPGDMLWFEIKGADQNFGYGEVKETWLDEETGYAYAEFYCKINGGQRAGRIDKIIEKPSARMETKLLQSQKEYREALKERNK